MMIQGINQYNYELYCKLNSQVAKEMSSVPNEVAVTFDLKGLVNQLGDYTYKQEDLEGIDQDLVDGLKKKFDISSEDVCKLQQYGFNLEQLFVEDYSGYNGDSVRSRSSDEEVSTQVSSIASKIEVIKEQNDNMYLNTLKSNEKVTINSLYESNYKGNHRKNNHQYSEEQIAALLQMNGLSNSSENMWAAHLLVDYGMDVNVGSINRLKNIDTAIKELDAYKETEKAKEDEANGEPVGEHALIEDGEVQYDHEMIKGLKEILGGATDDDLGGLVTSGKEITINNIKEMMHRNTQKVINGETAGEAIPTGVAEQVQEIKAQINQIRAKLTTEAAQKISEKMPLESTQLSELVDEINTMSKAVIEEALTSAEVAVTDEHIEIMEGVMATKQAVVEYRSEAIAFEMRTEEQAPISEMQVALQAYGENESVAERRFGESIKTVEGQIEAVLKAQGIEVTAENIQAAKALITNGLEITPESLQEALDITLKINTFIEEMTPTQAAIMIKEGVNPYYASINTLNEWMSEEKFVDLKNSIAESIVALEDKGELTPEQKETMLGLYKIIQAVNNNREEVIGYMYKNDLPLTVEHLQEATKYVKTNSHVEVTIDDQFGEVVSKNEAQTAKSVIEGNREQIAKTIDVIKVLEDMELPINETNMSKLQKINAFLYPYIKEQFKQTMGKFEGMSTLPQSFLDKLEYIKSEVNETTIQNMIDEGVPLTVSNIYWMDKIEKEPGIYAALLEENGLLKQELPEHLDELEEALNELEEQAKEQRELATLSGDIRSYKSYKQLEEVVNVQRELVEKEGIYQIPFMINGEQRLVNLHIQKDSSNSNAYNNNSLKAVMTYEARHMGTIKAYIEMKDDQLSYKVEGENAQATYALQANRSTLDTLISAIGYGIKNSSFEQVPQEANDYKESLHAIKRGDTAFEEVI